MPTIGGGSWGVYDDQNDLVHDLALNIENKVLPSQLKCKTYTETSTKIVDGWKSFSIYTTKENKKCRQKQLQYIRTHLSKVINQIKKLRRPDWVKSGLAMYTIKYWMSGANTQKIALLPKKFRQMIYQINVKQLQNFNNYRGWKDPHKRVDALRKQIRIFKPANQCQKIQVDFNSFQNTFKSMINHAKGKLKTKTLKMVKKKRPSPSYSATSFKIGTRRRGNDKKMWKVINTKNHVKRWVHI